ncbi:MAG TPA: hypothetical protein VFY06_02855 [Verrucomicrobiae bacterium]|nr:hypothetical protein [Verrucomicrobiae bacterium]
MKLIPVIFIAFLLSLAKPGLGQGFTNLDFESAILVPVPDDPYGAVQFSEAFPGWTESHGGFDPNALYNNVFLDSAGFSIVDHDWTNSSGYDLIHGGFIDGNYTAILQAGYGSSGMPTDVSLSQTGLVPAGMQSLRFDAFQTVDAGTPVIPLQVTLDGLPLPLVAISNRLNSTVYGADISAWQNQTAQLTFTVIAENPHVGNQYLYLDAIQFSIQPVPETGTFALTVLGALLLGFQRRQS